MKRKSIQILRSIFSLFIAAVLIVTALPNRSKRYADTRCLLGAQALSCSTLAPAPRLSKIFIDIQAVFKQYGADKLLKNADISGFFDRTVLDKTARHLWKLHKTAHRILVVTALIAITGLIMSLARQQVLVFLRVLSPEALVLLCIAGTLVFFVSMSLFVLISNLTVAVFVRCMERRIIVKVHEPNEHSDGRETAEFVRQMIESMVESAVKMNDIQQLMGLVFLEAVELSEDPEKIREHGKKISSGTVYLSQGLLEYPDAAKHLIERRTQGLLFNNLFAWRHAEIHYIWWRGYIARYFLKRIKKLPLYVSVYALAEAVLLAPPPELLRMSLQKDIEKAVSPARILEHLDDALSVVNVDDYRSFIGFMAGADSTIDKIHKLFPMIDSKLTVEFAFFMEWLFARDFPGRSGGISDDRIHRYLDSEEFSVETVFSLYRFFDMDETVAFMVKALTAFLAVKGALNSDNLADKLQLSRRFTEELLLRHSA